MLIKFKRSKSKWVSSKYLQRSSRGFLDGSWKLFGQTSYWGRDVDPELRRSQRSRTSAAEGLQRLPVRDQRLHDLLHPPLRLLLQDGNEENNSRLGATPGSVYFTEFNAVLSWTKEFSKLVFCHKNSNTNSNLPKTMNKTFR